MIIVKVPQVQTQAAFQNSGLVPINNLRRYDDDNQPAVVIDAETGERHPIWAEVDANPTVPGNSGNPADANLIIRPARNFEEGHALHRRPAQPARRAGRTRSTRRCRSGSTATA